MLFVSLQNKIRKYDIISITVPWSIFCRKDLGTSSWLYETREVTVVTLQRKTN
jgi:hypothetical protein